MANVDHLALAKARYVEALTNLAKKKAEFSEYNSKCVVGQIRVQIWRIELAKAKVEVRAAKRISPKQTLNPAAEVGLWDLPEDVLATIFSRVPVDERVRCGQVSKSWRAQMKQPAVWRSIDFTSVPGRAERVTDEVLLELSMLTWEAQGCVSDLEAELAEWRKDGHILTSQRVRFGLRSLNVSGCPRVSLEMLQALTVLSPGLRHLSATSFRTFHPKLLEELGATADIRADVELVVPAPADLSLIARILTRAPPEFCHVSLCHLSIVGRELSLCEVAVLACAVRQNGSLSSLHLTYCGLKEDHMGVMLPALCASSSLTNLSLGGNDELGEQGMTGVIHLVADPECNIQTLGLHSCFMGTQTFLRLAAALPPAPQLTSLDLSYNDLTAEAGPGLAQLLGGCPVLRHLDLASNWLKEGGCADVAAALATNRQLRLLDLKGNGVGPHGASSLAHSLGRNTTLRTLRLHHLNSLGLDGSRSLAEALRGNTSLTCLKLEVCGKDKEVGSTLLRALETNTDLQTLTFTLCGRDTSEGVARLLGEGLRRHGGRVEVSRCCPRPPPGTNPSRNGGGDAGKGGWEGGSGGGEGEVGWRWLIGVGGAGVCTLSHHSDYAAVNRVFSAQDMEALAWHAQRQSKGGGRGRRGGRGV